VRGKTPGKPVLFAGNLRKMPVSLLFCAAFGNLRNVAEVNAQVDYSQNVYFFFEDVKYLF
jgi:hypothetical protein